LINTEKFTGKAESYAKARPGYPDAAMDYISTLMKPDAVIADIGAGTGKFTELLTKRGYNVFAVEPNADMREHLATALQPYTNTKIVDGSAEATTLPDHSVDVITCAQALHWFDPNAFWAECRRIGKPGGIVIAIYNNTPGGSSIQYSKQSTDVFFKNPAIREFPNPMFYTRDHWLAYMTSHSDNPLPSDPGYNAHIAEMNSIFDRENADGLLRRDVITKVFSERIEASIQFTDVCFIANDVLRLRAFYEAVFGVKAEGNEIHSGISIDGLTLVFDHVDITEENQAFRYVEAGSANNVIVGFNVDDVDAEYQRLLTLGAQMLNEPTTHPWGARSFQFRDPDGNILNFRTIPKGEN